MEYYVDQKVRSAQLGTKEEPFLDISRAADIAVPGDTVYIASGVYREWVKPKNGGTDDGHRIVYTALPGETVVVSGAELLQHWTQVEESVWTTSVPNTLFEAYHPYLDPIFGDWYTDLEPVHHTGEVFCNGKAMYEVPSLELLKAGHREYGWHAEVTEAETVFYIHMPDGNPNENVMEMSVRPFCFFPEKEHCNYITVSNLIFEDAATQWAPPTAFQAGAVGTHWSRGWIIEDCVVRNSKCAGISVGKRRDEKDNIWSYHPVKGGAQTYTEIVFSNLKRDWNRETVGGHIIRRNQIYDCGQAGIVGNMGGAFSSYYDNVIHDINTRGEFTGAEMAAIKLHCAIDAVLENNLLYHNVRGIWLDWEAQGAIVRRNACFENKEEDLFIEVCHGPITVENNVFLSERSFLNVSQGTALVHNLFAGKLLQLREPNRFTMYHFPHDTFIAGSMIIYGGDDKVLHNLYLGKQEGEGCGNQAYDGYPDFSNEVAPKTDDRPLAENGGDTLPVRLAGNVYLGGAKRCVKEPQNSEDAAFDVQWRIVRENGVFWLESNLPEYAFAQNLPLIGTAELGVSFESEAAYENADGTPFILDTDFSGKKRSEKNIAGPFSVLSSRISLNP